LAKEHTVSDDYLTHSLTLEEGVEWADGTPFTAEDVAFSYGFYTTIEHTRWTAPLAKFESATIVDDTHVDIVLSEPDADFVINYLVETPMLPKHLWGSLTERPEHRENDLDTGRNVGTGPYMLVEYVPEEFYRYEANPNYWAGTPRAKEIVIILYADIASAMAAFQAQEIDMMFVTIPPEQLTLFEAMPGVEVAQGSLFGTTLLIMDNQQPPFDVKEVRQAIYLAVDRKDIVDTVLLGAGTPGSAGWTHPDSPIFNREVVTEYNPEKANELLDGLGYVDTDGDGIREFDGQPMSFEFNARADNAQWMRATELIAEDLLDIGIEGVITPVEGTTFWDKIWPGWDVNNGRNFQITMSGWSPPLQLIPTRVTSVLHSDLSIGRFNLQGTANPAFDSLLDELNAEIDVDKRVELMKELQALIAEEAPITSLYHVDGLFPHWSDVIDSLYFINGDGPLNPFTFLPLSARP
jgi:peptide/nickel transport system substrate-binding protein